MVACKLKLPQELSEVHDTFHVCNLKRCLSDENHIILLDEIQANTKFHLIGEPIENLDQESHAPQKNRMIIVIV